MHLFRNSKKKETSTSPASQSPSPGKLGRTNSLQSITSNSSSHSTSSLVSGKLKLWFKTIPRLSPQTPDLQVNGIDQKAGNEEITDARPERFKKRVSTIVEADTEDTNSSFNRSDSDFESGSEIDGHEISDEYSESESETESEEGEEEHKHAIKDKGKCFASPSSSNLAAQLSTIMGYCGMSTLAHHTSLGIAANEESKRTFSLMGEDLKIYQLSSTTKKNDPRLLESVVSDEQVKLIEKLNAKLSELYEIKNDIRQQYDCVLNGKTLYDRYGVVQDIIGKGSYGIIKIINPNVEDRSKAIGNYGNMLYAVKELQKKPRLEARSKESCGKFIKNILSEFVISSTLNYKHIVKTVDLMVTLPPFDNPQSQNLKINQVMECTSGGDLFSYLTTMTDKENHPIKYVSIDEFDCFIKQVSKGLRYMHKHGVAHCDLKLENILINYESPEKSNACKTKINLKLSDFGKSNVFKTKWDKEEQLMPYSNGPIGSEPYIAPEEHLGYLYSADKGSGYSLTKKDCWALGIIALLLFNIRKHYFSGYENEGSDPTLNRDATCTLFEEYSSGYIWHSTDLKYHSIKKSDDKDRKYKDKAFDEYVRTRMVADYDSASKEWLIKRKANFKPIENLFKRSRIEHDDDYNDDDFNDRTYKHKEYNVYDDEDDELCELRKMLIYKLLDPSPASRLDVEQFLKSDWMTSVECCT